MPKTEEHRRKILRYRTKKLPHGKYVHIAIVKRRGPKGGVTIAGPIRQKKG